MSDVYVIFTITSDPWNARTPGDYIADMEVLDGPPRWHLAPLGQVCRVGSVNGGDSIPYDNTPDVEAAARDAGVPLTEWVDGNGNKMVPVRRPGPHDLGGDTDDCPVPNCPECDAAEARRLDR